MRCFALRRCPFRPMCLKRRAGFSEVWHAQSLCHTKCHIQYRPSSALCYRKMFQGRLKHYRCSQRLSVWYVVCQHETCFVTFTLYLPVMAPYDLVWPLLWYRSSLRSAISPWLLCSDSWKQSGGSVTFSFSVITEGMCEQQQKTQTKKDRKNKHDIIQHHWLYL